MRMTKEKNKGNFLSKWNSNLRMFFLAGPENNYRPHIFAGNFLFSLMIGLTFLRLIILPFYFYFPKTNFFAEVVSGEIIAFLNEQRGELGLSTLRENPQLVQAATLKAQDILANDYFSHTSLQGITPWHWFEVVGYEYSVAGENLAIGFLDSLEVHRAWNDSGSHRQNLLDERFEEIGVAALTGDFEGRETTVVVQLFAKPREEIILPVAIMAPETEGLAEEQVLSSAPDEGIIAGEPVRNAAPSAAGGENLETETMLPASFLTRESGTESQPESDFNFRAAQFFANTYDLIMKNIIFLLLIVLALIFVFNFYLIFKSDLLEQAKPVALKNLIFGILPVIVVLTLLSMTDKLLLIRFLPHRLRI